MLVMTEDSVYFLSFGQTGQRCRAALPEGNDKSEDVFNTKLDQNKICKAMQSLKQASYLSTKMAWVSSTVLGHCRQ